MKYFKMIGSIVLIALQACFTIFEKSENSIIKEVALTQKLKAISYYKYGNAKTSNKIYISIIPINQKLENVDSGNCFIAETNSYDVKKVIEIHKEMKGNLEVIFKERIKVLKNNSVFINEHDTINIKYIP